MALTNPTFVYWNSKGTKKKYFGHIFIIKNVEKESNIIICTAASSYLCNTQVIINSNFFSDLRCPFFFFFLSMSFFLCHLFMIFKATS